MKMKESKRKSLIFFTLLEVVIALSILSLGISGILYYMSSSLDRSEKNMETVDWNHDLIQAAEYLLLCGPEADLDESWLSGENRIVYEYLPYQDEETERTGLSAEPVGLHLETLKITLYKEDGFEADSLSVETFCEDNTRYAGGK